MLKILIIDDDDIVLMIERKLLERSGFTNEIFPFKKGEFALEYLMTGLPNQNYLILLDINMPGMNGWQFLEKLQELKVAPRAYVIMVTSSIDGYDREVADKYSNVIGFIEKPITQVNCEKIKNLPKIKAFF